LSLTESLTIRGVAKTVGNAQLRIQCEEQRKASRFSRIDIVLEAGVPPDAAQAGVVESATTQNDGGSVVQKLTERLPAESLIVPRVQDELMP
jgi:hypothetical protein